MQLFLDPADPRSLSTQLYDQLSEAIATRRLAAGARLAPTRAVADELGVSRSTVTAAYSRLAAEGHIDGRRGGGSLVNAGVPLASHPTSLTALAPTAAAAAIGQYGDSSAPAARYDLTAGRVDHRLFPLTEWRRCTARALASLGAELGRYGDPAGDLSTRRLLAAWVARSRGVTVTPEQIVITHGAAHAIDLVARTLLCPGETVAVEEPGYPPVSSLLRLFGADVVGVPVDEDGIVVEAIPPRARLVYVTPSHQYPLGTVLSRQRRLALLRWAHRRGAAIIEDDYDSEFRYGARPLEPLQRLDRDGRVVYVGTFSKILSPALRLGFAVLPLGMAPAVTAVRQATDAMPSVAAAALGSFIEGGGLDRHLRRARKVYSARHRAMRSALSRLGATAAAPLSSKAGLHISMLVPDAPEDHVLVERASSRGLAISTLRHTARSENPPAGVVIGFGAIATEDIPVAIGLLGECLQG